MSGETWTVKKRGGEHVGYIRKLIIDSQTRQLTFADIVLTHTNQLIRIPWDELEVRHDGIFMKLNDPSLVVSISSSPNITSLDTLEVPIQIPEKVGQSRRTRPIQDR